MTFYASFSQGDIQQVQEAFIHIPRVDLIFLLGALLMGVRSRASSGWRLNIPCIAVDF